MSEIEKLNMIAEWQEQYKQLIEDLNNSKKRTAELEKEVDEVKLKSGYATYLEDKIKIEDLEKENAELKGEADSVLDNWCRGNNPCPHLAKLEKENAELKERLEIEQNARGDWFGKAVTKDRLLTEAKEIIKKLLSAYTSYADSFDDRDNEILAEAEQFLNEVEK